MFVRCWAGSLALIASASVRDMNAVSSTGVEDELWMVEPAEETERSLPGVGIPVPGRPGVGIPDDRGFWFVDAYMDMTANLCKLTGDRVLPIIPCLVFFSHSQGCSPPRLRPPPRRSPPSRDSLPLRQGWPQPSLRQHSHSSHSLPLSSARTASNLS